MNGIYDCFIRKRYFVSLFYKRDYMQAVFASGLFVGANTPFLYVCIMCFHSVSYKKLLFRNK